MLISDAINSVINVLYDEIDEIEDEIERLVEWIRDNPGKFDGVVEANRRISVLSNEVEELYDDVVELLDELNS